MSTFDHSFTSFIDHYILLLAARFRAPLDANSICSSDADPMDLVEPWERVARCVRDSLSHPQTAQEREELKHIDVGFFTADVCRERALYFQWQLQQEALQTTESEDELQPQQQQQQPAKRRRACRAKIANGPSSFDITTESLRAAVENIYAAARAQLPSTLDTSRPLANGDSASSDEESVVEVAEFPFRTEEAEARDFAIAEARDVLLTKVQSLQAEFFAQHRSWVDVPLDLDTPPKPQSASVAQEPPREQNGEPAEVTLDSAVEVLRRNVLVNRPPRPSQMREEDYAADFDAIRGIGAEVEAAFIQAMKTTGGKTQQAAQPVEALAQIGSRANRWSVLEYERSDSDDSGVMD